ncbi:MAG: hypothetical protein J6C05_10025 [Prevotella sp.]|nr:hypothetical protein [Prevotella sp.]
MKKYFYLFAVICSMAMFTACSSDDDEPTPEPTPGEIMPEILGTWNLAPVEYGKDDLGMDIITAGPVVVDWQCPEGTVLTISMGGYELPMPITETIAPLAEAFANKNLPKLLQNVTFEANGDITAMYSEADNLDSETWTPSWKKAEGYAHWAPATTRMAMNNEKLIMVYLDSEKILSTEDDAEDKTALSAILNMFKDGIPVHIRWNADGTGAFFYVDKDYIAQMLKGLSDFASQLPTDGMDEDDLATVEMLKGILGQIPGIMDKTQKFEAGLQLVK